MGRWDFCPSFWGTQVKAAFPGSCLGLWGRGHWSPGRVCPQPAAYRAPSGRGGPERGRASGGAEVTGWPDRVPLPESAAGCVTPRASFPSGTAEPGS